MTGVSLPPDGNFRSRYSSFRLTPEGVIDTSYTKTTTFRFHAGTTDLGNDIAYTACRTPENGILLVGISSTSAGHTLLKLTAEGKVDSTYGNNGFTRQNPTYSTIFPRRIVPAQGGGCMLCANARLSGTGNPDNTAIYKFTAAGLYDSTFGTNGIALTPYTDVPPTNPWAVDAVQDASGKIWVAHFGQFISGGPRVFSVSRFLPNGNIDNTYGNRGHVSTSLSGVPRQIYLGADGLPLLSGNGIYSGLTTDQDLVAIKVNPNLVSINPKIKKHLLITPSVVEKGKNFSVMLPSNEPVHLMLTSANGRQLPIAYQPTDNQIYCNTDQLPAGLYQVQIRQNQQVFQGRVLVQ